MLRSITIGILTVGLIAISYWGYREHEEKNALLIHAENTYQRSFHELSYHMDLLHDQIGTSLAMNSGEKLSPQFVELWRISSAALTNVGQLPLTLLPFNKTEEFLSKIGDFTYQTAIRNLDDEPLSSDEVKTLEQLYKQAAVIKDELRQVQHMSLKNNLRWMDVELALATEDEQIDNTIIDGFKTVEKGVGQFSEGKEGVNFLGASVKEDTFKHVTGKRKSEKAIRDFSKKLFNISDKTEISITKSGEGADIPVFSVFYEDGKRVYMDITEKGAHPITILVERPLENSKLSLNDGQLKAERYLKEFGYESMGVLQSQQFDHVGVYTFLYTKDNVRVFPDAIVVKIALDNGDILGLNAKQYVMNHHEREIPKPEITIEEARKKVNQNLQIHDEHLAIIQNTLGKEVLVYEFLGTLQDETYRAFINAQDGREEKVEKLTGTETNFER